MEVHHSHHIPKKLKEYLTEFLMLFAAVTLGFFAENIREHQIEKHREIQYLKNIHLDIQQDLNQIQRVSVYNTIKQNISKDLIELYSRGIQTDLPKFYYLIKTLALRSEFQHSSSGLEQLKNAGGLRLIEDPEILHQIQLVEIRIGRIEALQDFMEQNLLHFRLKTNLILDALTVNEMNNKQLTDQSQKNAVVRRFSMPTSVLPLKLSDDKDINEIVNLALSPVNTTMYINSHLKELKKESMLLDKMLVEKFGDEF